MKIIKIQFLKEEKPDLPAKPAPVQKFGQWNLIGKGGKIVKVLFFLYI
jgi:hypothetical protein